MIEKIDFSDEDTIGFEAKGEVTLIDYEKQIKPSFERARTSGKKIRFLFYLGPDFKGFTPRAAWEDFKIGTSYLRTLDRCAIVSDVNWIRLSSKFIGALVPCAIRVFTDNELGEAKAWLTSGEIGLDHHLDESTGLLAINIEGPLTSENFEILTHTVDTWVEKGRQLNGIIIKAKSFPGWENLGSFLSHFKFIKNHHKKIKRVALVADGLVANLLPQLGKHFVAADIKHFKYSEYEKAQKWIGEEAQSVKKQVS